jgi:hypothetical protein
MSLASAKGLAAGVRPSWKSGAWPRLKTSLSEPGEDRRPHRPICMTGTGWMILCDRGSRSGSRICSFPNMRNERANLAGHAVF